MNKNHTIITYTSKESAINVDITVQDDTIWASQKAISEIFDTDQSGIARHLANIFSTSELDENNNMQKMHTANSKQPVQFYSLDAIISVGYRANSRKATQFRIWATSVLKQYLRDGYSINEEMLRADPEKLNKLAVKIRELRANEKNIYSSVRECFKLAASDYEPSSKEVRKFYSLLQDKFHHAVTKMTSSKLILDRADHADTNMGLQTIKGSLPTKAEIKVGKNYLSETEIYRLHLLSEQFLLYAESTALMDNEMTMESLHDQLDKLLELNGYPVFDGYIDFLKEQALQHADSEYKAYIEIKKLEHIGVSVDLELFYVGEYDSYKEQTQSVHLKELSTSIMLQEKNLTNKVRY